MKNENVEQGKQQLFNNPVFGWTKKFKKIKVQLFIPTLNKIYKMNMILMKIILNQKFIVSTVIKIKSCL